MANTVQGKDGGTNGGGGILRNISIRGKLLIGYFSLFVAAILLVGFVIYFQVKKTLELNIRNQLHNSTALISDMVRTSADISIKSYLRAVAEDNKGIVENLYRQYQQGELTEQEAREKARQIILSQKIAKTGYLYCVDSQSIAVVHPNPEVEGVKFDYFDFVKEQIRRKEGYLTYEWKNPGEPDPRAKALYMTYFQPWDWIISATSYKEEFIDLLSVEEIRGSVLAQRIGKSGYCYIVNSKGDLIAHPSLQGNIFDVKDPMLREAARSIMEKKSGMIEYEWQNPKEKRKRRKMVIVNYLPELDWYVASSGYIEEIYAPLSRISNTIIAITLVSLVLTLLFTYWVSSAITSPIHALIDRLGKGATGDFSARLQVASQDEIGRLAQYFNIFMEKLQEYSDSLRAEVEGHISSETALRKSEEQYRTLADNTPDMIYETDSELRLVYLNRAGFTLSGYTGQDLERGLSFRELLSEKDFAWTVATLRSGKPFLATHRIRRRDGSFLIGENSGNPIFANGLPVGLRGIVRDVTEKRELEEKLIQAQKMETIGTLAGGLAHDFNNVLAGITSTLSIIRAEKESGRGLDMEKMDRRLDIMEHSGQRAVELVQRLLALSHKSELSFSPVDARGTIEQVIKICRNTFDKAIEIKVELPEERAMIHADPAQIEQVLLNLCVNAHHAMTIMRPPGEPPSGRLVVSLAKMHADGNFCTVHPEAKEIEYWRLSVSDTGVGMDGSTLSKIFVPFYTTKDKGTGTGLGLAIVYTIVQQHHGIIDCTSEPGAGTTFTVYLPVLHHEGAVAGRAAGETVPHGEGMILVVDDEEMLRETARSILEICGYQVITARDGKEGLVLFREYHRDIKAVLLDLVMPRMSGERAYLEMKKVDPNLKVLLASGFKHDARVDIALEHGINGFIQKPFTVGKLGKAIAEVIRGGAS